MVEFTKCRYQGSCVMNIDRRRLCSFCRLNKCNEMGMRKDWIWNEQAKKTRKLKIEFNKIKRDLEHCCTGTEIAVVTSTTPDPSTNTICTVSPAPFYNVCDVVDYILYCEQNLTNIFANIYVRAVELELTVIPIATPGTKTGDNFNQLELCRLNELFSVTKPAATTMINSVRLPWPIVTPQTMADKHQAMDYTLESEIKYVVKLFKKLVKFSEVNDLDRIKLIKHSSIQIHCLRAVTNYNVDDECFYLKMDNDNMIAKIQLDSMRHSTSTHSRFREFLKKLKYEIDHDANIIDLV
ncbi:unnamed protein product [Medioppia subpectinata]|uniref:Nuclear receptor domain-containing protein n=1 Tax=Medioppia subpectinata TaxID=1979941 RepID=A0A7R9KDP8_9ACAR|nr:unnamed protein product [Medioppia subpectinata]CAG2101550.1 unnamed protein product [Medioppia subpectinata]